MLVSFNFYMKKLQRSRDITVYLPENYYQSSKRYPVLYIQDGQNAYFDDLSYAGVSWGFLDYARIMELDIIMVAIPCNFEGFKRIDEYGPWKIDPQLSYQDTHQEDLILGGEGKDYIEWMIHELKPYIDSRFQTDPDDNAIVGSSMGGVISAYGALKYPHIFKRCACLSTAFWFYIEEFKELIESQNYHSSFRFYFDLGEFEGCGNPLLDDWYIESNNAIYEMLKHKVENLEYRYFEGAVHNEQQWRQRVPLFMEFLYSGK